MTVVTVVTTDVTRNRNANVSLRCREAQAAERLIDVVNRTGSKVPQVCYHAQLGPIQTCDACMVEIDAQLFRVCATAVSDGLIVDTKSETAAVAQREAFDRILSNHVLYCTVCDNRKAR